MIQTTMYRPGAFATGKVVRAVSVFDAETRVNGPPGEVPSRISARIPGVGLSTTTCWTLTRRPASSTRPTPDLKNRA